MGASPPSLTLPLKGGGGWMPGVILPPPPLRGREGWGVNRAPALAGFPRPRHDLRQIRDCALHRGFPRAVAFGRARLARGQARGGARQFRREGVSDAAAGSVAL